GAIIGYRRKRHAAPHPLVTYGFARPAPAMAEFGAFAMSAEERRDGVSGVFQGFGPQGIKGTDRRNFEIHVRLRNGSKNPTDLTIADRLSLPQVAMRVCHVRHSRMRKGAIAPLRLFSRHAEARFAHQSRCRRRKLLARRLLAQLAPLV